MWFQLPADLAMAVNELICMERLLVLETGVSGAPSFIWTTLFPPHTLSLPLSFTPSFSLAFSIAPSLSYFLLLFHSLPLSVSLSFAPSHSLFLLPHSPSLS